MKQHQTKGKSPVYSDQASHTYYDRCLDEDQESAAGEAEEDDDEDTSEDDSEDALEDGALGGKTA